MTMTKINWKPGTMLYPVPPAMISCGTMEKPNIMTAAWTGIICSEPAMTYVSIRPSRYSHEIISKTMEFVINLPTLQMVTAADYCGVKSGRDIDKFKETELTPAPCPEVSAPMIEESPVSIACKVKEIRNFGTHDMFLAEIVGISVDDKYLDESGKLWLEKTGLLAFAHGHYYTLGRNLGSFGFSVNKNRLAMMKKMAAVEVKVKEPKAAIEKTAEKEARPQSRASKFAKHTGNHWEKSRDTRNDKFDGKAKFNKARGEYSDKTDDKPKYNKSRCNREDKPRGEYNDRSRDNRWGKPGAERNDRFRSDRPRDDKPRSGSWESKSRNKSGSYKKRPSRPAAH